VSARWLGRLRLEVPVLQAPLGGGISSPELAATVSNAGGLGSIGMRAPDSMVRDFALARSLARGRPLGMGLLVPFTRRAHVDAIVASTPDAVVLMAGFAPALVERLHAAGIFVLHQIGSREEAERALAHRADALVAQGVEAGGHVLGVEAGRSLLRQVLPIAGEKPVLLAGGIATADDVKTGLGHGAAGVVVGTRYLLTHEAHAHSVYKERVLGAKRTLLTTLFGFGWSQKHRVVPNAATARFCDEQGRIARWAQIVDRMSEPLVQPFAMLRDPSGGSARRFDRLPLFSPGSPRPGQPEWAVECTALYAGESATRIQDLRGAFEITKTLAEGARGA